MDINQKRQAACNPYQLTAVRLFESWGWQLVEHQLVDRINPDTLRSDVTCLRYGKAVVQNPLTGERTAIPRSLAGNTLR